MNKEMLKLGNRELDCAELPLGTLKREWAKKANPCAP